MSESEQMMSEEEEILSEDSSFQEDMKDEN